MKHKPVKGTTARLLAVADIVADGSEWMQSSWSEEFTLPGQVQTAHDCGSYGCIAGWAVALTPTNDIALSLHHWIGAGSYALGLQDESLADFLFDFSFGHPLRGTERNRRVAMVLRYLATIPEEKRDGKLLPKIEKILEKGRY